MSKQSARRRGVPRSEAARALRHSLFRQRMVPNRKRNYSRKGRAVRIERPEPFVGPCGGAAVLKPCAAVGRGLRRLRDLSPATQALLQLDRFERLKQAAGRFGGGKRVGVGVFSEIERRDIAKY